MCCAIRYICTIFVRQAVVYSAEAEPIMEVDFAKCCCHQCDDDDVCQICEIFLSVATGSSSDSWILWNVEDKRTNNTESSARTRLDSLRVVLSRSCNSVSFACVQKSGIPSVS